MSEAEQPAPTDEEEVLDAEVVDEGDEDKPPEVAPMPTPASTAIEVRPASDRVLMPLDSGQVVDGMKAYQQLLHDLLEPSDWQGTGSDKFLKKSGWRKIARAFNLSLTKISLTVERDAEGNPVRAEAVFRALAPNGQVQDGDGYCAVTEPRFQSVKGRQKIENDLRATATTRAKNRAISDLVGMGEVSAEEVDATGNTGPGWAAADPKQASQLSNALIWLFDGDTGEAEKAWNLMQTQLGGTMYGPVADGLTAVLAASKRYIDAKEKPDDDKPPTGAPPETAEPS